MTEDFVPFELAKKLKEKGFDEKCIAYYWEKINEHTPSFVVEDNMPEDGICILDLISEHNKVEWSPFIDAPTISQVLKWLRKEKQLHIVIVTGRDIVTNTHLWGYKIWDLANHVWLHARIADNSYELAALSGIEFVIDNLIL